MTTSKILLLAVFVLSLNACGGGGGEGSSGSFSLSLNKINWSTTIYGSTPGSVEITGTTSGIDKSVYIFADATKAPFIEKLYVGLTSQTSGQLTVVPKSPKLAGIGDHNGQVTVSLCYDQGCNNHVKGSPQVVNINYNVKNDILLSKESANFYSNIGSNNNHQEVISIQAQPQAWKITNIPSWLEVSPTQGSGDTQLTFSTNANTSEAGKLSDSISIKYDDGSAEKTIAVNNYVDPQYLYFDKPVLGFSELSDSLPKQKTIKIMSNVETPASWELVSKPEWIELSAHVGQSGDSIDVSISPNHQLDNGQHYGQVIIVDPNGEHIELGVGLYVNFSIAYEQFLSHESTSVDELAVIDYSPIFAEKLIVEGEEIVRRDLFTSEELSRYSLPLNYNVVTIRYSTDGKHAFLDTNNSHNDVLRIDFETDQINNIAIRHIEQVQPFYHKGKNLVVMRYSEYYSFDNDEFVVYDLEGLEPIWRDYAFLNTDIDYGKIAISPDGKYLFMATYKSGKGLGMYDVVYNRTANEFDMYFKEVAYEDSLVHGDFSISDSSNYLAVYNFNYLYIYTVTNNGIALFAQKSVYRNQNTNLMFDGLKLYLWQGTQISEYDINLLQQNTYSLGMPYYGNGIEQSFDKKYIVVGEQLFIPSTAFEVQ
ncbi:MAG: BACON domain-containing protein [Kangiella sp.]|nr:BACON domain-containing protein [Kangiella sp.]